MNFLEHIYYYNADSDDWNIEISERREVLRFTALQTAFSRLFAAFVPLRERGGGKIFRLGYIIDIITLFKQNGAIFALLSRFLSWFCCACVAVPLRFRLAGVAAAF